MTGGAVAMPGPGDAQRADATRARLPRLGFLGVGWIGASRMQALAASGAGSVVAIADPDPERRGKAARAVGDVPQFDDLDTLLAAGDVDGVVIATPSALHAEQAVTALAAGCAVFCQKPLGRDSTETQAVVAAARRADRLLAVDLSYRFTEAARRIKQLADDGAIGDVYALDLNFHNAYGPDKPWFKRRDLAGGGCLIDLGTHLVDLALWLTNSDDARVVVSHVLKDAKPLDTSTSEVEDHALAELELASGALARVACSWWLPAGRDCVVDVTLYGTTGALALRNVGGSFYDFEARLQRGTTSEVLSAPPDDWGGRALADWAARLAADISYDRSADDLVTLARVLDHVYEAAR